MKTETYRSPKFLKTEILPNNKTPLYRGFYGEVSVEGGNSVSVSFR